MKEISDLFCGKSAVGGNNNSTRDTISSRVSGEAVGLGLGIGVGLISTVISGLLFLIARIDILSSSLLGLLFYLLTYRFEWNKPAYIIGVIAIVLVSMMLQHFLRCFGFYMGYSPVLQYRCLSLLLLDIVQMHTCIRLWQFVLL